MGHDTPDPASPRENPSPALIAAYEAAVANLRHYSTLRFAMLTVFLAVTGAAGSVGLPKELVTIPTFIQTAAFVLCFIITVVFFYLELLLNAYIHQYIDAAQELEQKLGIQVVNIPRAHPWMKASYAMRVIYITLALTWCMLAVWSITQ